MWQGKTNEYPKDHVSTLFIKEKINYLIYKWNNITNFFMSINYKHM